MYVQSNGGNYRAPACLLVLIIFTMFEAMGCRIFMDKGSSSWLSPLFLEQYGFVLHKGEFIDAICLRYGYLPSHPIVCGKDFSLSHAPA